MSKEKISMLDLILFAHLFRFIFDEENEGKRLDIYTEGDKLIIKKSDIEEGDLIE